MAFINEHIPEADHDKYDLRNVIGERNPFQPGYLFAEHWTIDRDKEIFLAKIWTHREADFDGWTFFWKGQWIFFKMKGNGVGKNPAGGFGWIGYMVKDLVIPKSLSALRSEIVCELEEALAVYAGAGIFSTCSPCEAKVDYVCCDEQRRT